jgi:DNA-binding transcriptional LysR family regulator
MQLNQLKTLMCIADLGSISKAADQLRIAQPALSRQIRMLEAELGVQLFDRHGRGMVITSAGMEVLSRATRIMSEIDSIQGDLAQLDSTLSGRVVIGMPPTISGLVTVKLAASIRRQHPRLELCFVDAFSGYLLDWLQRGELDIAVLYGPRSMRSVRMEPLLQQDLFLVGAADTDLSANRAVPFSDLDGETLVLPSSRHSIRNILESSAADLGITLHTTVEADSISVLKGLVREGLGKTLLPMAPVHEEIQKGTLKVAPIVDPMLSWRLVLAFPNDRTTTAAGYVVANAIRRTVTEALNDKVWGGHLL